jgi:hypothetical protein
MDTMEDSGAAQKTAVVLGTFSHEGLDAKLRGLNMKLVRKGLRSSERNWLRIVEIISNLRKSGQLATVLVYAPTSTLLHVASSEYDSVRGTLFDELKRAGSHVFLHEDNFSSKIEPAPWDIADLSEEQLQQQDIPWSDVIEIDNDSPESLLQSAIKLNARRSSRLPTREEWLAQNAAAIRRAEACLTELRTRDISMVPFRTRSDVTIRAFELLEDAEAGIFLRLYVPHGRYQSEQFEDFLTMFSRYLREVESLEFSISSDRTLRGTNYVFKGRGEVTDFSGLNGAISRFDEFLSLAQTNPKSAELVLLGRGCGGPQATHIVAKYARQNRRLAMEIKHEHDRKRLQLQQEMEAELLDDQDAALLPIPTSSAPSGILTVVGNLAPVMVNVTGSVLGNSVERTILGDVTYTPEDKAIMSLMTSLSERMEVLRLQSDVSRLKDKATSPEERQTAVQRLKGFLYKIGKAAVEKSTDFGMDVLLKYLERQIGA